MLEAAPQLRLIPKLPTNLETLDIPWSLAVDLAVRRINIDGVTSLSSLASKLKLPGGVIESVFRYLLKEKFVEIRGSDGEGFNLSLTMAGHKFATDRAQISHYAGPAPVSLRDYEAAVRAQSARPRVNRQNMQRVFDDLVLENDVLDEVGPALISQKSVFLFGPSGNGKTSLAERMVNVYEDAVVIPYAVEVDGQIITVFDPVVHRRVDFESFELDPRWIPCHRPAVVVGGELTADMVELRLDPATNIYSAPIQMKANNGILVVDDFGRQVITPTSLLNRWILPLDRRVDYQTLSYGLKFQVPFELMLVFATNLEPTSLMDPAYLRRLPNKIMISAVNDRCFLEIFRREAAQRGFEYDPPIAERLLSMCRDFSGNSLRACYPRDICGIAKCINEYEERSLKLSPTVLERAVRLYFAGGVQKTEEPPLS